MTAVAELVTRVNDLKEKVDEAAGQQAASSDTLTSTRTEIEGKAEAAKPCPGEAAGYKARAEAAKPKVTAIPGIDDIASELHRFAVPEPDFCLPLISNLDLERGFGNVTFTRSTTATYVDKTGVLRTAKANEPRFEKEGILIEGSSANLVYTSESGGWGCDIDSVTSREGSGFGSFKSRILLNNGKGRLGRATKNYTYSDLKPGDKITASVWIRNIGGTNTLVWLFYGKTDSSGNSMSSQVTVPAKNTQWTRYTITETVQPGNKTFQLQVRNQNAYEVEVACPQVEALPFATSYIPTSGSPVSRAGEVFQTDPSTLVPFKSPVTVNCTAVSFFEGDTRAGLWALQDSGKFAVLGNYSEGGFKLQTGGVSDKFLLPQETSVTCRVADRSEVFINGSRFGNDRANTTTSGDSYCLTIGGYGLSWPLWGRIRNFRIWHQALTDDQIAML